MAQVGIREYDAKKWFFDYMKALASERRDKRQPQLILVRAETKFKELERQYPWLKKNKLVIKPDQLFGKRGKHNLIGLNLNWAEAQNFIKEKMGKPVTVGKSSGKLTHFLIEPYLPHKNEYFMALTTQREGDRLFFSRQGGIDIEEEWGAVRSTLIPVLGDIDEAQMKKDLGLDSQLDRIIGSFLRQLYGFFKEYGFCYLELNPFVVESAEARPLDMVAKVDSTAVIECAEKWGEVSFPAPFGRELTKEEADIARLDEQTGASLKLTVLNPEGRIWTMVAGGGASVIFADTICDLGMEKELANYGEYSGNPSKEETYQYARTILDLMTRKSHGSGKYLIIGGGIANFTDVAKTFEGIIQALTEFHQRLKTAYVKILVRRGGPNYETGLKMMKNFGEKYGIETEVFGPETHMTKVIDRVKVKSKKIFI